MDFLSCLFIHSFYIRPYSQVEAGLIDFAKSIPEPEKRPPCKPSLLLQVKLEALACSPQQLVNAHSPFALAAGLPSSASAIPSPHPAIASRFRAAAAVVVVPASSTSLMFGSSIAGSLPPSSAAPPLAAFSSAYDQQRQPQAAAAMYLSMIPPSPSSSLRSDHEEMADALAPSPSSSAMLQSSVSSIPPTSPSAAPQYSVDGESLLC